MFLARVYVSPKSTVNDPEGRTIHGSLEQLGFETVESVRAGKFFQVRIDEERPEDADEKVRQICEKLLANPIVEEYSFELEELATNPPLPQGED